MADTNSNYQLSVDLIGAKELKDAIDNVGSVATQAIINALNKTAYDLERLARSKAPHKKGGLRNSIHTDPAKVTGTNIEAKVGTNLKYAVYQEKGTAAHTVRVVNKKVLYSKETNTFYGKSANIPQMSGKFYMKQSRDEIKPELTNNLEAATKKIINHLSTKGTL